MVISQPQGIILHIIIVLHQRCLNCSECFQRHMFYTCNYNIRVTHRNGAIKHIFYESDPRRDHQQIVLYSFCRSMRLLFIWQFKYLLQIFLYEDLSTLTTYICRLYFPPRMPAGPHFVTQPILLVKTFLIFDINHQQNTRRSDQIETIKTLMQLRALVSHGRFYQWLRFAIFF